MTSVFCPITDHAGNVLADKLSAHHLKGGRPHKKIVEMEALAFHLVTNNSVVGGDVVPVAYFRHLLKDRARGRADGEILKGIFNALAPECVDMARDAVSPASEESILNYALTVAKQADAPMEFVERSPTDGGIHVVAGGIGRYAARQKTNSKTVLDLYDVALNASLKRMEEFGDEGLRGREYPLMRLSKNMVAVTEGSDPALIRFYQEHSARIGKVAKALLTQLQQTSAAPRLTPEYKAIVAIQYSVGHISSNFGHAKAFRPTLVPRTGAQGAALDNV